MVAVCATIVTIRGHHFDHAGPSMTRHVVSAILIDHGAPLSLLTVYWSVCAGETGKPLPRALLHQPVAVTW